MIDWLDFVIPCLHDPIPAGRVMSILPSGELEYDVPKRMQATGTYESKMWVRSQGGDGEGRATELYISGNPAKFLQGHNVFGCELVCDLAAGVVRKILDTVGISSDLTVAQALKGNFSVKRIDITRSFSFASRNEVKAVLSSLAIKSRSRMGRAQTSGGTVYHGKQSRRHTLKFYCKAEELEAGEKHKLPAELEKTPIKEFAETLLRAELTLRSKELIELEKTEGKHFTPKVLDALYFDYFGRIEMAAQAYIPSEEIKLLSRSIRDSYLLWKEGVDVRPMMSKPTFYRHRSELLPLGIDIALPNEQVECEIIPLFRKVTGRPVGIPDWAYQQGLVYQSRVGG
ncbi:phage/plasmid replication protein, II/X family [Kineobactrum salinum]|uniref:Replication-associated protein G2P n=3 Tax=Kineobactrum salinum TaxID=2708301 RepID=A0A6C0U3N7_9GAMM|nr:phage/plasmid replication protein, II/X family [Kineobactrum salinum]QIB64054.1 Replication-associated protein G2P [Kineobactrum salinum]